MNISFSMTTDQVRETFAMLEVWLRTDAPVPPPLLKDVTRRLGWINLKPGQILDACEKCQGIPKGSKIVKMGKIRVVSIRLEPLRRMIVQPAYGEEECRREGFPWLTPAEFCDFFMKGHKGVTLATPLTRIEFSYVV